MTQLPNYQVNASPISNFETFGEAAPSAPATVEGMLAPPIDTYTPTMRLLGQLSNTLTSFFQEEKVRENETVYESAQAEAMKNQREIVAEARKGNMLKYADLVDKGLVSQDENPWAAVGSKRALAKMNVELIRNNRDKNLASDFANNTDGIQEGADPTISVATYMASRTNPLGLSEDILKDHYYSINFEKEFSQLRERTTTAVIGLRNDKAREDTSNAIFSDVRVALNTPDEEIPEGAVDFDGNPVKPSTHKDRVQSIISDPQYRATFGNKQVVTEVGTYLIELAKDGDVRALDALMNVKLSNGQTILASDDAVSAAYGLAESTIARAMQQRSDFNVAQFNRGVKAEAEATVSSLLVQNPNMTPAELATNSDALGYDAPTGKLTVMQRDRDGNVYPVDLDYKALKDQALEIKFSKDIEKFQVDGQLNPVAAAVGAMEQGIKESDYVNPRIQGVFTTAMNAMGEGRDMGEDDVQTIEQAYTFYQNMKASPKTINKYLDPEQKSTFFLLDQLLKGQSGFVGAFDTEGQVGSGNISAAVRRIATYQDQPKSMSETQRNAFTTAFNKHMNDRNIPAELRNLVYEVGEAAVGMGLFKPEDMQDGVEELLNNMFIESDNFKINTLMSPGVADQTDAESLFTQLTEHASRAKTLHDEGTIIRDMQDYVIGYHGFELGTIGYREQMKMMAFVSSAIYPGQFEIRDRHQQSMDQTYDIKGLRKAQTRRIVQQAKDRRQSSIIGQDINAGPLVDLSNQPNIMTDKFLKDMPKFLQAVETNDLTFDKGIE